MVLCDIIFYLYDVFFIKVVFVGEVDDVLCQFVDDMIEMMYDVLGIGFVVF